MTVERRLVPAAGLPSHFFVEPPPEGFNPLRASDQDLERYGLPHRPDPKTMPDAARLWLRAMRRIRTFVVPELTVQPIVGSLANGPSRAGSPGPSANSGSNWSGLVVTDGAPYTGVWGTWTIPAVQAPPTPPPNAGANPIYRMVAWVGLGGYGGVTSLLQAGTAGWVNAGGQPSYYAWFEWYPQLQVAIGLQSTGQAKQSFPVAPGQTIVVNISQEGVNGLVSMANLDTGVAITPIQVPVPTTDYQGNRVTVAFPTNSAEWIVERPSPPVNGVLTRTELADFGEVNFTSAGALNLKQQTIPTASDSKAIAMTMIADDGVTPLAEETTVSALHVVFQATAAGQ